MATLEQERLFTPIDHEGLKARISECGGVNTYVGRILVNNGGGRYVVKPESTICGRATNLKGIRLLSTIEGSDEMLPIAELVTTEVTREDLPAKNQESLF